MAATGVPSPTALPQPTIEVRIGHNTFKQGILLTAIADTEAQTSYVGPDLMHMLNLKQRELSKSVQEGQFLWSVLV